MQNYSGFMGGLYALAEWIMRFAVINIIWMIINLPILCIILAMVFTPDSLVIIIAMVPLAILFPILFFPSTTAAFATVRDWIMNIEQTSLTKAYWKHLKKTYKKSLMSGTVLTFIWIVWLVDFYYFNEQNGLLAVILFILGLMLFVYTINFLSLSVHYHMDHKALFKNAFFITVGSPLLFLSTLLGIGLLFYISARQLWFLFPFFFTSMSVFLSFFLFYQFTLKTVKKH